MKLFRKIFLCHAALFPRAAGALDAMRESVLSGFLLDLAAVDAGRALRALGEITGDSAQESVIDAVFSRFCVGK